MSAREFEKLVERIDLNADGAINFDEFAASLVDWQQVRAVRNSCCVAPCSLVQQLPCNLAAQHMCKCRCPGALLGLIHSMRV